MKTIAVMMEKGGSGKTTTAQALAVGLNNTGKSVVAVDLDPQSNLSYCMGIDVIAKAPTLHDVFKGDASMEDAIKPLRLIPSLDVVTGGLALSAADMEFAGKMGREKMLAKVLATVADKYDYAIVDTPPSLGLLTMNAAAAADCIVIPTGADALSLQGLYQLLGFIDDIRVYCNPAVTIDGILLTMFDEKAVLSKALVPQIEELAEQAGTKIYKTRIRKSQQIKTSQALQEIDIFSKASIKASADYKTFVAEFLEGER